MDQIDLASEKSRPVKHRFFTSSRGFGALAAIFVLAVGVHLLSRDSLSGTFYSIDSFPPNNEKNVQEAIEGFVRADMQTNAAQLTEGSLSELDRSPSKLSIATDMREADSVSEPVESEAPTSVQGFAHPIGEATAAVCASISGKHNAMVLIYSEFDYESFRALLEREAPELCALLMQANQTQQDGLLLCETTCGTALAIHEWLVNSLPRSDQSDPRLQEAESSVMLYLNDLDPDSGSLRRVITWEARTKPIDWPEHWPENWAQRVWTEKNWALFFPREGYAPAADRLAYLAFLLPQGE